MLFSLLLFILEGLWLTPFSAQFPENSLLLSAIIIVLNSVLVFYEASRKKYSGYLIWGYLFRLALLVWDCNFSSVWQLPNSGLDTWTYHLGAVSGIQNGSYGRGGFYSQTVAVIYRMFGIQMPIGQYFNVLLSMSMIVIAIKIAELLELEEKYQKEMILLLCFLPNLAIMNSILLRETPVMFLLSVALLFFVRWFKDAKFSDIVLSAAFGLFASLYHSGAIALVLGVAMIYLLYDPIEKSFRLSTGRIILSALLVVGFIILNNIYGDAFLSKFGGASSAEDIIATSESREAGGSAYKVGFNIGNANLNLIVNTPIRMFYFVGSPLPWEWRGLNDIIAFAFDAILFLYTLWIAIDELRKSQRSETKNHIIIFLVFALISAAVFAWGVSNAGTALRHREKFIVVYVVLLALCRQSRDRRTITAGET